MSAYAPGMGITYPHTVRALLSHFSLSPLPERISTSTAHLSPFCTPYPPWWITYPPGVEVALQAHRNGHSYSDLTLFWGLIHFSTGPITTTTSFLFHNK
jgi:hypothetical protein